MTPRCMFQGGPGNGHDRSAVTYLTNVAYLRDAKWGVRLVRRSRGRRPNAREYDRVEVPKKGGEEQAAGGSTRVRRGDGPAAGTRHICQKPDRGMTKKSIWGSNLLVTTCMCLFQLFCELTGEIESFLRFKCDRIQVDHTYGVPK